MAHTVHDYTDDWEIWNMCLFYIEYTNLSNEESIKRFANWLHDHLRENDKYMSKMEIEIFYTFFRIMKRRGIIE